MSAQQPVRNYSEAFKRLVQEKLSDERVSELYKGAGTEFAYYRETRDYSTPPIDLPSLHAKWVFFEAEYARRGYRTVPYDAFSDYGLSRVDRLQAELLVKRSDTEEPVLHAEKFREILSQELQSA